MEVLYPHCAGLDVHKDTVVACVRHMVNGTVKREVRTFKTTTKELLALSEWLAAEGCTHVAMEATGVYWKPVWHILSDGDFDAGAGQCRACQKRAGAQDRCQRRHLAGRSAGPRPDPRQLCAGSADPGDARPAAHPQAAGAGGQPPCPAPAKDARRRQHQARLGHLRCHGPVRPEDDRSPDRR